MESMDASLSGRYAETQVSESHNPDLNVSFSVVTPE